MATPSLLEFEQKMSAMVRTMWGEITEEFKQAIYLSFRDKDGRVADINAEGDDITYRENCAKWFCLITFYGQGTEDKNASMMCNYLAHVLMPKGKDPDADELWLLMVQQYLPQLFMSKVEHTGFSTIPRTTVISGGSTKTYKGGKPSKPKTLFGD